LPLAPQYWVGRAEGFTVERAPFTLEGFVELLLRAVVNPDLSELPDLSAVLEKIEAALPATASSETRAPMTAIYVLWHAFMRPEHHRPRQSEIIDRYQSDLGSPTAVGFVVRLLTSHEIEWTLDEHLDLVQHRRADLRRGCGQPLPARIDAALLLATAVKLWEADRVDEALALIAEAVNGFPGNQLLIGVEDAAQRGEIPTVDLLEFVTGRRPPAENTEATTSEDPPDNAGERTAEA